MLYLKRDMFWNDVNLQHDGSNLSHAVGRLQQNGVISASSSPLMVDDQSLVHVTLGEGAGLLGVKGLQKKRTEMQLSVKQK